LEGESGCGKSSLLAAALLPELKHKFRVIICGVSKDPFGRLSAAVRDVFYQPRDKQVGRAALVKAINDA
jgi:ABC-type dipeptide/oligopeptide/nickel transport system ATPase subunit